jgi:hypothetical protein
MFSQYGRPCSSFSIHSNHTGRCSLNNVGRTSAHAERPAGVVDCNALRRPHSFSLINRSINSSLQQKPALAPVRQSEPAATSTP